MEKKSKEPTAVSQQPATLTREQVGAVEGLAEDMFGIARDIRKNTTDASARFVRAFGSFDEGFADPDPDPPMELVALFADADTVENHARDMCKIFGIKPPDHDQEGDDRTKIEKAADDLRKRSIEVLADKVFARLRPRLRPAAKKKVAPSSPRRSK